MTPQEPEEYLTNEVEAQTAEIEDIETLKQALAEEKARADTNLAGWQRAQADFINYKRRTEQEREEIGKLANLILVLNLMPILDDLERALTSIPDDPSGVSWADGIGLIDRKLRTTLEAQGLSPINALGEPFDPNLHEAMMQAKGEEGVVIEELEKGYKFHDKVIRPAKVVVGSGEENKEE
ncbi:nucleotide exchange factor GrpE [Chloroflexota bacterium]